MKFPMIIVAAILLAGSVNAQEAIPEALQSEISPLQSTIDDLGGGVIQGANSAADCFKLPSDIAQIGCLTAKLQEEDARLESAYKSRLASFATSTKLRKWKLLGLRSVIGYGSAMRIVWSGP